MYTGVSPITDPLDSDVGRVLGGSDVIKEGLLIFGSEFRRRVPGASCVTVNKSHTNKR